MNLLIKGAGFQEGYVMIAGPGNGILKMLEFGRVGVIRGHPYEGDTGTREAVFDIIAGACRLEVTGGQVFDKVGERSNPFATGPTLICLPPGAHYCFTALSPNLDMAVSLTPADPGLPVAILDPHDVPEQRAGAANWTRTLRPGTSVAPTTRRLMMAETIVPPGNWTSYPPHKHDVENPPNESVYEEVYFYLFKPAGGYGIQRVYEPGDAANRLNEVYVVEDGDAVAIPRGYHPLVVAAGYQLVYIWALCGVERIYGAWSDDPAHVWIRGAEPIINA
ncbi:MAG: 5-deoxy-glucuronate isomerase [Chloroflexi bacterium]|nr:5-deoxy-glucuronate isomerase [Chloroflexota bacterium]